MELRKTKDRSGPNPEITRIPSFMEEDFLHHIWEKQHHVESVPANTEIARWAHQLIHLLYPEHAKKEFYSPADVKIAFQVLEQDLRKILNNTTACSNCDNNVKAKEFFESVSVLYAQLNTDITAALLGDPAAKSEYEIIRAYPGFFAICFYRIAHLLLQLGISLLPRILTEYAHSRTGIDIHPGAQIGDYFFIDHGTGTVIGETCQIGNHVKLYQGVTLGALSVDKSMASTKRHPTVEDHVVIYSGATILGGETVVGHHSIIGGNVWLTKSVPPGSTVYHTPSIKVLERQIDK